MEQPLSYKDSISNDEVISQTAHLKELADRAGEHLQRMIVVAHRPGEGWIAAYSTMSSTDWPPVFGDGSRMSYESMVQGFETIIGCFEPRSDNSEEDAAVRRKAEECRVALSADYAFVSYEPDGYSITFRKFSDSGWHGEWVAMHYAEVMNALQDEIRHAKLVDYPNIDDTYLGTGRDYGR